MKIWMLVKVGFCMANGKCGVADPAKAVCEANGFNDATTFTTKPGPVGARQCAADGTGCFTNENASCNTVFAKVTCVR